MKEAVTVKGNCGPGVRSDCEIKLQLLSSGGLSINLNSKVVSMYGDTIRSLCNDIFSYYGIENAIVEINDSGALDFVIAARIEAAIREATGDSKEYLPEMITENLYKSSRNRFRFSRLYLPGNTPAMMLNAGLHAPDGVILDLEDSVAVSRKQEARLVVRNALRQVRFYGAERMVRINQGEMGLEDLDYVVPHNVHLILVPKCESAEYLAEVVKRIEKIKSDSGLTNEVYLMPIIESARGVEMAFDIASASSVVAMAIGLEDYTADLGVPRTPGGDESLYARMRIVNASKAAGIQPIDSVFSDVADMDGLRENVLRSRSLGFEGMGCIHPRQIPVIQKAFAPEAAEIEKAKKIVLAFREAESKGLGVVSLGSKMIDPPVVNRALRVIDLAGKMGLIDADWDSESENIHPEK
jgi:citrate lyase subunit beta/citryl-CoA lyase